MNVAETLHTPLLKTNTLWSSLGVLIVKRDEKLLQVFYWLFPVAQQEYPNTTEPIRLSNNTQNFLFKHVAV